MPDDLKISAMTPITGANIAADDVIPVVDVSTSTNRNITRDEYLSEVKRVIFSRTNYDAAPEEGVLTWDADEKTLSLGLNGGDTVLQIGQESHIRVRNNSGALIANGTVVMQVGTVGNSGRLTIAKAVADGSVDGHRILGITTEDIANGADGLVTNFGKVRQINTTAFSDGAVLYANPAVPGGMTATRPAHPNAVVVVAFVVHSHASGTLFVHPSYESQPEMVTLTGTQTLTNKTINLASNTLVATSAQLAAAVSDETGSGSLVFGTGPTLTGAILSGTARANSLTDAGRLVFVGDLGAVPDFDTRASFIAANLPEPVNTAVVEGRVWVADADGPITANNGRTWRPAGVVTPGDFGAPGNNVALDTPALLEWADYVARVAKVGYVDKIYRCSAELDFTQGGTVAASGITIYGDSDRGCEIQWQRMGCDQWWMKFNWMGSTADSADVTLRNWTARGYNSTLTKDTSNGILGVNNHRWTLANFNITYYGGSALYLTRSFNSDGYNLLLGSGGTQYLRRDDELVASITAGSLNFTLSSGTVSADDVGAAIILTKAVPTYPESSSDSRGMANRIATVTSATTGTFETAPFASSSSAAIHFAQARFTSTAASDEITLDAEVLDDGDVGRMVWLVNAGDDGRTLHTTIAEVIDASTARLAVAATRSTSGVFTTSMTLHCGPQPAEYADQPGPPVNDIEFSAIQIEQHYGGGLFLGAGTHAYLSQIKIHGDDVYLTKCGPAIISDCRSNTIHQYHQEFCACAPDEAVIVMGGPRYSLTLTDTTVGEHYANCWFVQHCEVPADTQSVTINGLQSRIRWGMMKGVFKGTSAQSGAVNGPLWDIDAAGDNALGTFVAPRQYGDVRLWANASELRVLDGVPAAATDGSMVYNQGNIVAPVSQSGGVPTGGIVQRGVTGAGEYVRFADGTQICWQTETESLASTIALHGGFRTPGQLWTYPVAFISAEVAVLVSVRNLTAFGANAYPDSTTRCFWHATTITSEVVAADRTVSLTAIGRWF